MPAIGQISAGMRGRAGDETTDRYSAMTSYRPDSLAGARPAPEGRRKYTTWWGTIGDRATDSGADGWGAPRAMTFSGPPEREERVCQARKQGRTADGSTIFRLHGQDGSRISSRGEILDPLARERRQAKKGNSRRRNVGAIRSGLYRPASRQLRPAEFDEMTAENRLYRGIRRRADGDGASAGKPDQGVPCPGGAARRVESAPKPA